MKKDETIEILLNKIKRLEAKIAKQNETIEEQNDTIDELRDLTENLMIHNGFLMSSYDQMY